MDKESGNGPWILYLQNKNKYQRSEKQVLHYDRPNAAKMILWGLNEFNDSIYIVLDKDTSTLQLAQEGRKPVPDWLVLTKDQDRQRRKPPAKRIS